MSTIAKQYRTSNRRTQARFRQRQNKKRKANANNELVPIATKCLQIESELLDRKIKEAQEVLDKKEDVLKKKRIT